MMNLWWETCSNTLWQKFFMLKERLGRLSWRITVVYYDKIVVRRLLRYLMIKNISSLTQQWGLSCFRFLIRKKKNRISITSQIFGLGWTGAKLQLQKMKIPICSRTYVVWSEYSRFTHTAFKSKEIKKWKTLRPSQFVAREG